MMKRRSHTVAVLALVGLGVVAAVLVGAPPAFAAGYYPVGDWPSISRLTKPAGVAVALNGEVFVADAGGRRIAVYDSNGDFLREFDGRDAPGARLVEPSAIQVGGPDALVHVADKGTNRISAFRLDGSFVRSWGGPGSGNGQFSGPSSIAFTDSGQVVVADRFNNRIQVFSPDGQFVRIVPVSGLSGPSALALRGAELYVTDTYSRIVRVLNVNTGAEIRRWGSYVDSGGATKSRYSAALSDLAIDASAERVYVSDGGRTEAPENRPPSVERVIPNSVPTPGSVEATASGFKGQGGITLHAGHLYVADTEANKVVRVAVGDMPTSTLTTFAPPAAAAPSHLTPKVVAAGPDGSIYVAEHGESRVRKFDASGHYLLTFDQPDLPMSRPSGILATHDGPQGEVYVSDTGNDRLLAYSTDGKLLEIVGSPGSEKGQYLEPKGLAKAGAGYIAVVDAGNKRVQLIAPAQYDGDAYGAPSMQEPFGTSSSLSSPTAIAWMEVGGENRFLVTDQNYRRVSVFSDGGAYQSGFNILGSPSGQFASPQGICVGPDGESFLVVDAGNHRIEQFSAATRAHITSIGIQGYSRGSLWSPSSVTLAPDSTMVVADTGNDRVVQFGYDRTDPVVEVSGDIETWINREGTVSVSATDTQSGVVKLEYQVRNPQGVTGLWADYSTPVTVTGHGKSVVAYRATDAVGNVLQGAAEVWIDTVKPTGTVTFANGASSVKSGSVPVASNISDPASGLQGMRLGTVDSPGDWVPYSTTGSIPVSGEGPKTLQAQYRDAVDNEFTLTRVINVDDSGPVMNIAGLPTGYAPGAVTLRLNATDTYSSVASVKYRLDDGSDVTVASGAAVPVSGNGLHSIVAQATDSLGNVGPQVEHTFRISELSAGGEITLAGGAPLVGSATTDVSTSVRGATEVSWQIAGGTGRGFGPIPSPWQVTFPGEGPRTLVATFRDVNGLELTRTDSVTIDLSAPKTTLIGAPERGGSLTAVSMSFSVWDVYSAVPMTYYSVDGGPLQPYTHVVPATRFEVEGNGAHTVRFYSVDAFGNTEIPQTVSFLIDDNPPVGTFAVAGAAGDFIGGGSATLVLNTPNVTEMRYRIESGAWSEWHPYTPTLTIGMPFEGIAQIEMEFKSIFGDASDFGLLRRVRVDHTTPIISSAAFAPRRFTYKNGVIRVTLRSTVNGYDPAALLGPPSGVDSWIWRAGRRSASVPAQPGVSTTAQVTGVTAGFNRVSATLVDNVGNIGTKGGWIKVSAGNSRPKVPTTARRNRAFTVSGSVPVAGAGATYSVQMYKRDSSGRWVRVKSYKVRPSISGSTAKLSKRVTVGRGSYRVVLYSAVDMRHVMGRPSGVITVR